MVCVHAARRRRRELASALQLLRIPLCPGGGRAAEPASAKEYVSAILSVRGEAVHTSSQDVGDFVSSDRLLNRIHTLILRAIENNAVSLFTDCPHREKLGWLEETHLMAPSMLYDFDFAGLFAATARNIADAQKTEGPKAGMVPGDRAAVRGLRSRG